MPRIAAVVLSCSLGALLAGAAHAQAAPAASNSKPAAERSSQATTPVQAGQQASPTFPDTPGLRRATEQANDNARFKRNDSNG